MIIKIREVIGMSPKSFQDALQSTISHAISNQKKITGAKVISQSVDIKEGKIIQYKVNAKIAYIWEE